MVRTDRKSESELVKVIALCLCLSTERHFQSDNGVISAVSEHRLPSDPDLHCHRNRLRMSRS